MRSMIGKMDMNGNSDPLLNTPDSMGVLPIHLAAYYGNR